MPSSRGSSQPRDRICVSCIGSWVLYWSAFILFFFFFGFSFFFFFFGISSFLCYLHFSSLSNIIISQWNLQRSPLIPFTVANNFLVRMYPVYSSRFLWWTVGLTGLTLPKPIYNQNHFFCLEESQPNTTELLLRVRKLSTNWHAQSFNIYQVKGVE